MFVPCATCLVLLFQCVNAGLLAHFRDFANLNTPVNSASVNTGIFPTDPPFPAFQTDPLFSSLTTVDPFPFMPGGQVLSSLSPFPGGSVATFPAAPVTTPAPIPTATATSRPIGNNNRAAITSATDSFPSGSMDNTVFTTPVNQNFFPNIPIGSLFTNLISGISNAFNPGSSWLTNDIMPAINTPSQFNVNPTTQVPVVTTVTRRAQTPIATSRTQPTLPAVARPQPPVQPSNTLQTQPVSGAIGGLLGRPLVQEPSRPTNQGQGRALGQDQGLALGQDQGLALGQGQRRALGQDQGSVVGQEQTRVVNQAQGSQTGQEPGGVAIGVGATLNLLPLGNPVKAPLPVVISTAERHTTSAPSPEQLLQRVQEGGQGSLERSVVLNLLRWVSLNNFGKNRDLMIKLRGMLKG